jgi:hypothetical protein
MGSSFFAPSFGSQGGAGFVPGAASSAIAPALGQSQQALANRYQQLGLGGQSTNTPEAMDLGLAPSMTGGLPGQFASIQGTLQNAATTPLGKNSSPANLVGGAGQIAGLLK